VKYTIAAKQPALTRVQLRAHEGAPIFRFRQADYIYLHWIVEPRPGPPPFVVAFGGKMYSNEWAEGGRDSYGASTRPGASPMRGGSQISNIIPENP
jgi:hypothetical protein